MSRWDAGRGCVAHLFEFLTAAVTELAHTIPLTGGLLPSRNETNRSFWRFTDASLPLGVARVEQPAVSSGYTVTVWKSQLLIGSDLRF